MRVSDEAGLPLLCRIESPDQARSERDPEKAQPSSYTLGVLANVPHNCTYGAKQTLGTMPGSNRLSIASIVPGESCLDVLAMASVCLLRLCAM